MVNHSTSDSREAKRPSKLAIAETIVLSLLTWFVAYYFDTLWYIISAIAIAPFLLLKSDRSTQKAIEWFLTTYEEDDDFYKKPQFWVLFLAVISSMFFIISYFISTQSPTHTTWVVFLFFTLFLGIALALSMNIIRNKLAGLYVSIAGFIGIILVQINTDIDKIGGIISIGFLVGIIGLIMIEINIKFSNLLLNSSFLILSPFVAFTLFIYATATKIIITLLYVIKYPKDIFSNITNNYYEHIMISDSFYMPELLPSISKKSNLFHLSGIWNYFHNEKNILWKIITYIVTPFWILGYLYRWSIKSTAWFYFPLVYLSNIEALKNEEKQQYHYNIQTWNVLHYANIIVGIVLLLYFDLEKFVSFLPLGNKIAQLSEVVLVIKKNIAENSAWLLVVCVILYIFIRIRISFRVHMKKENDSQQSLYFYIRVQYILYIIFLGWNVVHLVNIHLIPKLIPFFESLVNA